MSQYLYCCLSAVAITHHPQSPILVPLLLSALSEGGQAHGLIGGGYSAGVHKRIPRRDTGLGFQWRHRHGRRQTRRVWQLREWVRIGFTTGVLRDLLARLGHLWVGTRTVMYTASIQYLKVKKNTSKFGMHS